MWKFKALPLHGAFLIELPKFDDDRGSFVKTYQNSVCQQLLDFDFQPVESYFSLSKKDVIRGMHFQTPPYDHSKMVWCPQGSILDVIIDLRKASPTYGQFYSTVLSADNHLAYFIPKGFAHGFKSLEHASMTHYLVSSEYQTSADEGILYNSFGMDWEVIKPILSPRDLNFKALQDFHSPF
jgi:dTDP-4-dehydrorhamnose 3,5-epimerase